MTHDIFISYSYGDKPIGDAICTKLEHNNYNCWIALRDIIPREEYSSALITAIKKSKIILVVFHASSVKEKLRLNSVDFGFVEPMFRCCRE